MDPVNRYYGLYRGVVKDNKDPQKQRRLKLSIPQTTGTETTEWAWPMEPSSISTDVPGIGQGVWVSFIGGDPEYPVWNGSFGKNQGKNKKMFIKPLADSVSLTSIQDVVIVNKKNDGTKELDLTDSIIAIANRERSIQTTLNNLQTTVSNIVQGTGVQGTQGTRGPQGVAGAQGSLGAQGTQGASGPQGTSGSQGTFGTQGSLGTQGATGAGTQGTTGTQGATGAQGVIGSQGTTGAGTQGAQGTDGTQGSIGSQGTAGSGAQGTVGTQGAQGTTGAQGTDGTGAQGTQGSNGTQGASGSNGTQGVQGTQGSSGSNGAQGAEGAQGSVGSQGATGAGTQGATGSQGSTGSQGTTGSQGVQGTTGAGTQGVQGSTGVGAQGTQGTQGITGNTGAGGTLSYYGSFYDTTTQDVGALNESVGVPVLLGNTAYANGMSLQNGSEIKFDYAGKYDLQFSFQFHNTGGGGSGTTVEIWLVKNGTAVADTNTRVTVNTNSPYVVSAWDFMLDVSPDDVYELYWATNNHHIVMPYNTGTMGGPAIPSAIVTVIPVVYAIQGVQGMQGTQGSATDIADFTFTAGAIENSNDITLESTGGDLVLRADGDVYLGSASAGNGIVTDGYLGLIIGDETVINTGTGHSITDVISSISLTPGPQGTTGSQGTAGSQGTQGVQGTTGTGTQGTTGAQGISGATASAPLTLTQSSNNANYPLTISSANEQSGGTGYSDILKLTNSKSGATNINKHIRINSTGGLEIVNSAYSDTIFYLADNGNLSELGTVNGATLEDTGWISVTSFNNSFSGASVAYRKINNVVHLRGRVSGGTAGQGAFVLPVGYRPSTIDVVIPTQSYGTANINYTSVGTDGNVVPNASSAWLSSISFPVG